MFSFISYLLNVFDLFTYLFTMTERFTVSTIMRSMKIHYNATPSALFNFNFNYLFFILFIIFIFLFSIFTYLLQKDDLFQVNGLLNGVSCVFFFLILDFCGFFVGFVWFFFWDLVKDFYWSYFASLFWYFLRFLNFCNFCIYC
jgi:hypothetical protein